MREHRQHSTEPTFQEDYCTHRPMVERSIAWLSRGNRRVRHRGISRNNARLQRRIAGLSLRRMLARGLTAKQGTWSAGPIHRSNPVHP
ncbi:hypothetical protein ACX80O_08375 [Arthrobacter sp. Hz1]